MTTCLFTDATTVTEIGRPELDGRYGGVSFYGERFLVRHLTERGDVVLDMTGSSATATLASAVEGRHAIYVEGDTARIYDALLRSEQFFDTEKRKMKALQIEPATTEAVVQLEELDDDLPPYEAGSVRESLKPSPDEVEKKMNSVKTLIAFVAEENSHVPDVPDLIRTWLSTMKLEAFRGMDRNLLKNTLNSVSIDFLKQAIAKATKVS